MGKGARLVPMIVALTSILASCATETITTTVTVAETGFTTPLPGEPGATMEAPIPWGQSARLGDWEVAVVGLMPNANAFARHPDWNDRPRAGYQFVLVELKIKNIGTDAERPPIRSTIVVPEDGSFFRLRVDLVHPNEVDNIGRMPPGTVADASLVYEVPSSDVSGALVVHVSTLASGAFFSLG